MIIKEIPLTVASLAAHVKMTPIAWRFEPGCVVIVFEQGPKMRFDLEEVLVAAKPKKAHAFIKPELSLKVLTAKSVPKTFTPRSKPKK
jgi:hypothetical protein